MYMCLNLPNTHASGSSDTCTTNRHIQYMCNYGTYTYMYYYCGIDANRRISSCHGSLYWHCTI